MGFSAKLECREQSWTGDKFANLNIFCASLQISALKTTFVMKVMKIWFILFIVLFAFSKNSLYKMHFAHDMDVMVRLALLWMCSTISISATLGANMVYDCDHKCSAHMVIVTRWPPMLYSIFRCYNVLIQKHYFSCPKYYLLLTNKFFLFCGLSAVFSLRRGLQLWAKNSYRNSQ